MATVRRSGDRQPRFGHPALSHVCPSLGEQAAQAVASHLRAREETSAGVALRRLENQILLLKYQLFQVFLRH
jgi:hypothetical protein